MKQLFDLVRGAFLLTHDVQENREQIKNVRRDLDQVKDALHQMALIIQHERSEREKLALQLENVLLRFERRLPPPRAPKDRD